MGSSIRLYRIKASENLDEVGDNELSFEPWNRVDLYKIAEDLSIILLNTPYTFNESEALPYKSKRIS